MTSEIPGYALGSPSVAHAPISMSEFELLKLTALFGEDDVRYLRMSRRVLEDQVESVLDTWYGFIESQPHLVHAFARKADGLPDETYMARVRARFGRWIHDTAAADYGRAWLDYQFEIGRRHHRTAKNHTDRVAAADIVPYRYLPTLTYALLATLRPFLAKKGHDPAEVEAMYQAWTKSMVMQVTLWSFAYVKEGDF